MYSLNRKNVRIPILAALAAVFTLAVFSYSPKRTEAQPPPPPSGTLMWSSSTQGQYNWEYDPDHPTATNIFDAAAAYREGGYDDWRVPTLAELQTAMLDGSIGSNPYDISGWFWTSYGTGRWAWVVYGEWVGGVPVITAQTGDSMKVLKTSLLFVKFVRDVQPTNLCGNGVVDPGETPCNCPEDAGAPAAYETDCSDGIDNDCDGLVDGDDPDCGAAVVVVSGVSPNSMVRGTSTNVTISGSGFAAGAGVIFQNGSGATPTASNIVVVSSSQLTATITVGTSGPPRSRVWDVRVTNTDGSTGVLVAGFTVTQ